MTQRELSSVLESINSVLEKHEANVEFREELITTLTMFGPKTKVIKSKEIDGVMHHWCRYHQEFEPEDRCVMSGGKPKGYCKAAISRWNTINREIKKQLVCLESDDEQVYSEARTKIRALESYTQ